MNTKTITIDPITRLEGHDKITIFRKKTTGGHEKDIRNRGSD
jgi:coenzyme F420-reducing hydrogenase alpha subunit